MSRGSSGGWGHLVYYMRVEEERSEGNPSGERELGELAGKHHDTKVGRVRIGPKRGAGHVLYSFQ